MSLFGNKSKNKDRSNLAQISMLAAVPGILIAGPLIGFFGGQWLDKKFSTEPWLVIVGIILGFVAAGQQIYILVKKSQAISDREERERSDSLKK
ncbi:MAG: AtpZ/AtpI family protein [candidate division Zixibacteria bacterium]|nr:AtpZ/AtpI family protein [candidate division Zixibacteria bacterium]